MRTAHVAVAVTALLLLVGESSFGQVQSFERQVAPFPVRDTGGVAYDPPFLGGLDTPRPQLVDLDGDSDLDFVLQERRNRIIHFENTGAADAPEFEWQTDQFRGLEVGSWFRFGDLDGDGDLDLLSEDPIGQIRYYRNEGTASSADFVQAASPLRGANGDPIAAARQNVPALASLDCTGPPDLLLGGLDGRLTYYRHAGVRGDGVPVFENVSDAYQNVCVGPSSVCGSDQSGRATGSAALHGANALAPGDLDGDGDVDILWGDFFSESLYLIENTGSCSAPALERVADAYPIANPIETPGYNVPYLADVDADEDLDLFVGVLGGDGTGSSAVRNLLYLENRGTAQDASFTRRSRRFISPLDVGGASAPAVVDIDGDGDLDLVVGNDEEPGRSSAKLHFFENTGTATDPSFRHRSQRLLPPGTEGFNYVPAFGDLTGDGRPDLFVGTFAGTLRFYRNTTEGGSPSFERMPDGDVALPQGNFAAPTLHDVDGDGDRDLFVGSAGAEGTVAFFRNVGTSSAPEFRFITDSYAGIQVGTGRTHPAFADRDGDGAADLYVGTRDGIFVYPNTGTLRDPVFEAARDSLAFPFRRLAAPALADVDGDRRVDLLVGGDGGGAKYFAGRADASDPDLSPSDGVRAAPNPVTESTTLSFRLDERAAVRLSVFDLLGRRVALLFNRSLGPGVHRAPFPGDVRASGVYFYVYQVNGRVRDRGQLVVLR